MTTGMALACRGVARLRARLAQVLSLPTKPLASVVRCLTRVLRGVGRPSAGTRSMVLRSLVLPGDSQAPPASPRTGSTAQAPSVDDPAVPPAVVTDAQVTGREESEDAGGIGTGGGAKRGVGVSMIVGTALETGARGRDQVSVSS